MEPQKPSQVKCFVCALHEPKYNCPRCGVHYCSLDCYRNEKHQACSEGFYKEQVIDELRNMKGTPEDKMKMLEILQKESLSRDDDLSHRLAGIHMDDHEALWDKLTDHERFVFKQRLRTGNVDFISHWNPWWDTLSGKKKIRPKRFKEFDTCQKLMNGKLPNSSVKYNCVEVLLTYLTVLRLFNGDLFDSPLEVADVVYQLSNVLSSSKNFSDIGTVFIVFAQSHREKIRLSDEDFDTCVEDLKCFVEQSELIITNAFCDFHDKLKKLRRLLIKEESTDLSIKLYRTIKKIYFLAVYCNEHEAVVKDTGKKFVSFWTGAMKEREQFEEQLKEVSKHRTNLQTNSTITTKVLVEEL